MVLLWSLVLLLLVGVVVAEYLLFSASKESMRDKSPEHRGIQQTVLERDGDVAITELTEPKAEGERCHLFVNDIALLRVFVDCEDLYCSTPESGRNKQMASRLFMNILGEPPSNARATRRSCSASRSACYHPRAIHPTFLRSTHEHQVMDTGLVLVCCGASL